MDEFAASKNHRKSRSSQTASQKSQLNNSAVEGKCVELSRKVPPEGEEQSQTETAAHDEAVSEPFPEVLHVLPVLFRVLLPFEDVGSVLHDQENVDPEYFGEESVEMVDTRHIAIATLVIVMVAIASYKLIGRQCLWMMKN